MTIKISDLEAEYPAFLFYNMLSVSQSNCFGCGRKAKYHVIEKVFTSATKRNGCGSATVRGSDKWYNSRGAFLCSKECFLAWLLVINDPI